MHRKSQITFWGEKRGCSALKKLNNLKTTKQRIHSPHLAVVCCPWTSWHLATSPAVDRTWMHVGAEARQYQFDPVLMHHRRRPWDCCRCRHCSWRTLGSQKRWDFEIPSIAQTKENVHKSISSVCPSASVDCPCTFLNAWRCERRAHPQVTYLTKIERRHLLVSVDCPFGRAHLFVTHK